MTPQRILILMSNTGGGHRASALALQAGFERLHPGRFHIGIIDLLADHTFWPLNKSPQVYAKIATGAPWLWGIAYATEKSPWASHTAMRLAARLSENNVRKAIDAFQPDLVLSVHPMLQELTLRVLDKLPARLPFVTVVTDLATAHPLWFNPRVDACYVAGDEARAVALAAGLDDLKVHALGLPVRPAFEEAYPPREILKARLGLSPDLPAALLMGGGDGIGPVEQIAAAIARHLGSGQTASGQLTVICGRNDELRARLQQRSWAIPTRVLGFVEAVPEWMHASDCLITKAGPGTIAEAMICGLPVVLSGFIPGQEEGNLPYVVDNQAGAFVYEPDAIGRTVAAWFGAQSALRLTMAENARALGRPRATHDIVASIVDLMDARLEVASSTRAMGGLNE